MPEPLPQVSSARRDLALVCGTLLACLLPFIAKPIHLDDPTFLWQAQTILKAPLDPFGDSINWDGILTPLHWIHLSPPGLSYYLAVWIAATGIHEAVLHLALLPASTACVVGTYALARGVLREPKWAALFVVAAPVFLLSSSTLMADVPMVAWWVLAVVCWRWGLEGRRARWLWAGGMCSVFAVLTKYNGLSLYPLLAAYTLFTVPKQGWRSAVRGWAILALCLLACAAYFFWFERQYEHGALNLMREYSAMVRPRTWTRMPEYLTLGISYLGGCLLPFLLLAPWTWSPRQALLVAGVWFVLALIFLLFADESLRKVALGGDARMHASRLAHLALFSAAGVHVLALACGELRRGWDAWGLTLACWIVGVFVFASFLNWTASGRALLPLVPAAALLAARRIERRATEKNPIPIRACRLACATGIALGLVLICADYRWALSQRDMAQTLAERYTGRAPNIWFFGHWGFQWYLEARGAKAIDAFDCRMAPGDILLIPHDNASGYKPPAEKLELLDQPVTPLMTGVSVASRRLGAGFYAEIWGPLPFAFGNADPERYEAYRVKREIRYSRAANPFNGQWSGEP